MKVIKGLLGIIVLVGVMVAITRFITPPIEGTWVSYAIKGENGEKFTLEEAEDKLVDILVGAGGNEAISQKSVGDIPWDITLEFRDDQTGSMTYGELEAMDFVWLQEGRKIDIKLELGTEWGIEHGEIYMKRDGTSMLFKRK